MNINKKIIIALDGISEEKALRLAKIFRGFVWGFKINDVLLEAGTAIVPRLKRHGFVFCDVKLYDIPNTVANSVSKLCSCSESCWMAASYPATYNAPDNGIME